MRRLASPALRQAGVSLVELMIAMVLGLLLTAGIFRIYLSSKQSYNLQEAASRRQENARFALHVVSRDLRMAGYRGCLRDIGSSVVRNTLNTPTDFLYRFDRAVEGFEANGSAWSPALPGAVTGVLAGTDVLTVRTSPQSGVFIRQEMPQVSADLKVTDNLPVGTLADSDIVMVTDCGGAAIFQITNYTIANGNVVHNAGAVAGVIPGNSTKDLGRRYREGSELLKIWTVSYFVRQNGNAPALWRQVYGQAPQVLAEGVENLQVQYGQDTDGDLSPNAYRDADAVTDWRQIVATRIAVLVASTDRVPGMSDSRSYTLLNETVGPYTDGRLRGALSATVSLRNRLP